MEADVATLRGTHRMRAGKYYGWVKFAGNTFLVGPGDPIITLAFFNMTDVQTHQYGPHAFSFVQTGAASRIVLESGADWNSHRRWLVEALTALPEEQRRGFLRNYLGVKL